MTVEKKAVLRAVEQGSEESQPGDASVQLLRRLFRIMQCQRGETGEPFGFELIASASSSFTSWVRGVATAAASASIPIEARERT